MSLPAELVQALNNTRRQFVESKGTAWFLASVVNAVFTHFRSPKTKRVQTFHSSRSLPVSFHIQCQDFTLPRVYLCRVNVVTSIVSFVSFNILQTKFLNPAKLDFCCSVAREPCQIMTVDLLQGQFFIVLCK